jgi:hypothetical protein
MMTSILAIAGLVVFAAVVLAVLGRRRAALACVDDTPAGQPCRAVVGLTKEQAEDLLDWLEGHGRSDCEVSYEPATGFTVRHR